MALYTLAAQSALGKIMMDWIPIIFEPDFFNHLASRMSDWDKLRALAGIIAPIVILGGIYALGVVNPALGFAAGAAVSLIKAQYADAARDTVVQHYADHPGGIVSKFGSAVSEALTIVSIGEAYAESAQRLGELMAARAQELAASGKTYVETSSTGLTVHAPTGSSHSSYVVATRKFVDFQTLSKQSGIPVEDLIKALTGGK